MLFVLPLVCLIPISYDVDLTSGDSWSREHPCQAEMLFKLNDLMETARCLGPWTAWFGLVVNVFVTLYGQ